MTTWNSGYVSDIEYLPGFYREQSPPHLDLTCLVAGVEPPDVDGGVTYCELGCGVGVTTLLLAAADPTGRYVGIDFNPAHIARGRAIARKSGLANVELIEASFADMLAPGAPALPQFDYVTLHGVYSWISPENRQAVVRFLARFVKPGGVVYVTYNAMPGWLLGLPLQRMLSEYARLEPGRSDHAMERALGFLRAAQAAGARPFADPEMVARLEREVARGQIAYLAHEYLNENWQPLYHSDVARDFAEAKLEYVGAATLLENYPELALAPEQLELLAGIGVGAVRETFKDYFMVRSFRRDVFVRGARRLSAEAKDARLRALPLTLTVPRDEARHVIGVPRGEARLEEKVYTPVFDALAGGVRTIGELLDLPGIRGTSSATAVELAGMLVGSSQALTVPAAGVHGGSAAAFNRVAVETCLGEGRTTTAFAATGLRSGLHAGLFDLLAYSGLAAGLPPEAPALAMHAWKYLQSRGDSLRRDGQPVEGAEANLDILHAEIGKVLAGALPLWQRTGAL